MKFQKRNAKKLPTNYFTLPSPPQSIHVTLHIRIPRDNLFKSVITAPIIKVPPSNRSLLHVFYVKTKKSQNKLFIIFHPLKNQH